MSKYRMDTPILPMNFNYGSNKFFIKRDDLLPFSFGGNKVRIANEYFKDMFLKGCNCIVSYGSSKSNLNRVIANLSKTQGIPCYIISPLDGISEEYKTFNSKLIKSTGAKVVFCNRDNISNTVENVMNKCKSEGLRPYYIYGDKYGNGNQGVPVPAYVKVYEEILIYEKQAGFQFDYIFHASGTGTTQAGLICGAIKNGDKKRIVGISIARKQQKGIEAIKNSIRSYLNNSIFEALEKQINFVDNYICGGYGMYNSEISKIAKTVFNYDGIALDTTYTGKAFWGMTEYIRKKDIVDSNILFIHTGGTPLFFDDLYLGKFKENKE